jgi:hypothetical protein
MTFGATARGRGVRCRACQDQVEPDPAEQIWRRDHGAGLGGEAGVQPPGQLCGEWE